MKFGAPTNFSLILSVKCLGMFCWLSFAAEENEMFHQYFCSFWLMIASFHLPADQHLKQI